MSSNESITTLREGSDELEQRRIDIEKLGRERPAAFSSTWLEIAFVTAMLVSLSMAVRTSSTFCSTFWPRYPCLCLPFRPRSCEHRR